jgi:hypothetical protein
MKISKAIEQLTKISEEFGDIDITGGYVVDDKPPSNITVTNKDGVEIWPVNTSGKPIKKDEIDGAFIE